MKKFIKISTLALFILFSVSCEKIDEAVPEQLCDKGDVNHPDKAKYQNLINKILETGVPGVSMTVITPDGIWSGSGGKADLKYNIDLTPCHILRIGSVSKIFCAAAILKLQDEGKLNINDKASKYISLIIKNISGKNANDVVFEKLVQPLGLQNIYMSTKIPSMLSRGYSDVHDDGKVIDATEIDNNAVGGQDMLDGGLMANSYDLAIFLKALLEGEILSAGSLGQMETFEDITQDLGPDLSHLKQYGLGLMKLETEHGIAIGHYGSVHCFNSLVYYFPQQKVTVAIIRNGDSARSKKFFESKELFNYLF
ncbi:MAG: hypothetical protein H6Q27_1227 [Ignavibacteriaceae bacterium]|nr:hypothetical protein [Ignavibacteriaceae bacterium]